jgi:hypothetical protein
MLHILFVVKYARGRENMSEDNEHHIINLQYRELRN